KIIKDGEGKETEYSVNPIPHKPIDPYLVESFNKKPCCLDALFAGADPFNVTGLEPTALATENQIAPAPVLDTAKINLDQVKELTDLIAYARTDKEKKQFTADMMKKLDITSLNDIPLSRFVALVKWISGENDKMTQNIKAVA
ncbi:MAG: hypothetical protein ACYC0F_18600, partial [Rhodanobacter sp.]